MKDSTRKEQETLRVLEKYGDLLDGEEIVNLETSVPVNKTSPTVQQRLMAEKRKSEILNGLHRLLRKEVKEPRVFYYTHLLAVLMFIVMPSRLAYIVAALL